MFFNGWGMNDLNLVFSALFLLGRDSTAVERPDKSEIMFCVCFVFI